MQKQVRTTGRSNSVTRSGHRSFVTGCASNAIPANLRAGPGDVQVVQPHRNILVDPGQKHDFALAVTGKLTSDIKARGQLSDPALARCADPRSRAQAPPSG